ncbi:hypothetical protein O181_029410 [Austropuccinia psidii MF-1]|uniref:Uncharacterized protein n=1 Tax=Austropuccinia psidii MF-1 TaxID=1389203 RepID=A0A9Q3CV64_9BASI|nr:hypothetical protein [Austropuccinia psidii MF-1]
MDDAIREQSDDDQDPREEFLVEYQEEAPLEIQDIQFEEGMPQDTFKKTCANTHNMHKNSWLHQPKEWHTYIEQTQRTVCIDNAQHPLIIDSGAHCSIVA